MGLAATLDSYLADPARAAAVLPALGRAWPQLLASIAMGLRQAPSGPRLGDESPAPSSAAAAAAAPSPRLSYRAITSAELTAMVHVLELACLLAEQARAAALAAGLLPLLLAQLPAAPPGLATACLDALLALQLRHPPAFVAFAEQQGVQQVRAVGRRVAGWAGGIAAMCTAYLPGRLWPAPCATFPCAALDACLPAPACAAAGVPPAARRGHARACARPCSAVLEPAAHSGRCGQALLAVSDCVGRCSIRQQVWPTAALDACMR